MNKNRIREGSGWALAVWTAALFFWILSAAVSVPLLCRSFYYAHIDALKLTEVTPWTKAEMIEAFDEMMDFCMKGTPFGTGVLKWSESGMQHFADCAVLFRFDIHVLLFTSLLLAVLVVLARLKVLVPVCVGGGISKETEPAKRKMMGHGPFFLGGILLSAAFLVIGFLGSLDFDRAFVIFHHLFFPGKTNWIFYWDEDQIIQILPEVFFRNCAILVILLLLLMCLFFILMDKKLMKWLRGR